jgi:iron(II)-dependent oxidoreductase
MLTSRNPETIIGFMFWKKKEEKKIDIDSVKVTLKPIGKIKPGTYLTVLYAFIILAVLFAIFFLPGISAGGTYITFSAQPVKAGIWIDGIKVGVTPCQVLVKHGRRKIEFKRSFYKTVVFEREVGSFVFSLPFLPKRDEIGAKLEIEDLDGLIQWSLSDYASWAKINEFSASYQPPPILLETISCIRSGLSQAGKQKLDSFLQQSLAFTRSPFLVRGLFYAYAVLETGNGIFTQATLTTLAENYLRLVKEYENLPFWIYNLLPANISTGLRKGLTPEMELIQTKGLKYGFLETPWFKKVKERYRDYLATFKIQISGAYAGDRYLAGLHFVSIPGGVFIMGKSDDNESLTDPSFMSVFPHPVKVEAFFLTENEISNRQFKTFLDENPDWRPSARDTLRSKNFVDQEYLKDWQNDTYPSAKADLPVTYISYYAAKAYCDWLAKKAKAIAPSFQVRLPSEAEWEWASGKGNSRNFKPPGSVFSYQDIQGPGAVGSSNLNVQGLRDMAGNVWEWCNDWYAPASYLVSSSDPVKQGKAEKAAIPFGSLKVVRGGSWANTAEEIQLYTRGSQPPSWCSEFLGFRVVLAEY